MARRRRQSTLQDFKISTIVVVDGTPDLHYYCALHSGMGGSAPTPNNSTNSSTASDSEQIFQGHAVTQPTSSITATCNRVQRVGGIVSSTSGTISANHS